VLQKRRLHGNLSESSLAMQALVHASQKKAHSRTNQADVEATPKRGPFMKNYEFFAYSRMIQVLKV
jgi:hypothetical protein